MILQSLVTATAAVMGMASSEMACVCKSYDNNGNSVDSNACGFACKDVEDESSCTLSSDLVWAGIPPTVQLKKDQACADLQAGPKNKYDWPIDVNKNKEFVEEVHAIAPGVLETQDAVEGTFVVVLTDRIASSLDEPTYVLNGKRMDNLENQLTHMSQSSKTFCGQVTSKMKHINMMACNLSPSCVMWMAQQSEVQLIEPDGVVSTANSPMTIKSAGWPMIQTVGARTFDPRRLRGQPTRHLRASPET